MGSSGLSATLEDYLEAISRLAAREHVARVQDIARAVGVHKSTVSAALKGLSERGLVNYSPYALVTLTARGRRVAGDIRRRHRVIQRFLEDVLAVEHKTAEENACRMEHVVDPIVMERLSVLAEFMQDGARTGARWLRGLRFAWASDDTSARGATRRRRQGGSSSGGGSGKAGPV